MPLRAPPAAESTPAHFRWWDRSLWSAQLSGKDGGCHCLASIFHHSFTLLLSQGRNVHSCPVQTGLAYTLRKGTSQDVIPEVHDLKRIILEMLPLIMKLFRESKFYKQNPPNQTNQTKPQLHGNRVKWECDHGKGLEVSLRGQL